MEENRKLVHREVFLAGKIVSLCLPNLEADIKNGGWHTWFNNPKITEFLEHGIHPVSAAQEADIVAMELTKPSSLVLSMVSNLDNRLMGVISIKDIDHLRRRGEIALVTNEQRLPGGALEAMALMTAHAFDRLNLQKLYAGQHEGLWKWVNTLALIGYKVEGIRRQQGFRNGTSYDVILTGVTSEDFYRMRGERNGDMLCGDPVTLAMKRKKKNMAIELREFLVQLNEE